MGAKVVGERERVNQLARRVEYPAVSHDAQETAKNQVGDSKGLAASSQIAKPFENCGMLRQIFPM
jgi:hypothetical protein